jgi:putative aminopeptidase FrvX
MDTPELQGRELSEARLGGGIAINSFGYHPTLPFVGTTANPKLVQQMVATAERHELPYVRTISSRIMTDASWMQYVGDGVPVIELGIPCRYCHSPTEVATVADTRTAIDLLTNFVVDLPPDPDLGRG